MKKNNLVVPTFGCISSKQRIDTENSSLEYGIKNNNKQNYCTKQSMINNCLNFGSHQDFRQIQLTQKASKQKLFRNSYIKSKVIKQNNSQRCKTSENQKKSKGKSFLQRSQVGTALNRNSRELSVKKSPIFRLKAQKSIQKTVQINRKSLLYSPSTPQVQWQKTLRQWNSSNNSLNSLSTYKSKKSSLFYNKIKESLEPKRRKVICFGITGSKAPIVQTMDFFRHKFKPTTPIGQKKMIRII